MTQLVWLSFNQNNFTTAPILTGLPNLYTIDLGNNRLSDISALAGFTNLNFLYLYNNNLAGIHPLTSLTHFYYTDVRNNWLDIYHPGSAALSDIATLQANGTYVDYNPQNSLLLGSPAMIALHQLQFPVYSPAGDVIQVFKSGDLSSWTLLGTFTNASGTDLFTDTNATTAARFYRAATISRVRHLVNFCETRKAGPGRTAPGKAGSELTDGRMRRFEVLARSAKLARIQADEICSRHFGFCPVCLLYQLGCH